MPTPLQRLAAHTRAQLDSYQPASVTSRDPDRDRRLADLTAALVEHLRPEWADQAEHLTEWVITRWLITRRPLLDCIHDEIELDMWRTRYGRAPATQ